LIVHVTYARLSNDRSTFAPLGMTLEGAMLVF
jgi:hypothetical protein